MYHYFNKFSSQKDWKAYGSYQSGVDPTLSHCLYLDTEIPSYCFLLFQLQTIYWATWLNTLQPLFCSLTWCVMPSHPSPCRHAQHICALALFKTKQNSPFGHFLSPDETSNAACMCITDLWTHCSQSFHSWNESLGTLLLSKKTLLCAGQIDLKCPVLIFKVLFLKG